MGISDTNDCACDFSYSRILSKFENKVYIFLMYLFHRELTMAARILKINCEKTDSRICSLLTAWVREERMRRSPLLYHLLMKNKSVENKLVQERIIASKLLLWSLVYYIYIKFHFSNHFLYSGLTPRVSISKYFYYLKTQEFPFMNDKHY